MPKMDKKSTLLRQWEMMRMLTVSRSDSSRDGRWDKASEIAEKLNLADYDVSVRTVQRDLKDLSEIFPIELNDKNPQDYGWRWPKGVSLDIPGMSVSEALAMSLVEAHMKPLLPLSMLDGLAGVFSAAHARLARVEKSSKHSREWLDKVRVVPPAQPFLPPQVDPDIQAGIYQALLESYQIQADYQPIGADQPKEYLLHPLGLIMRGPVSYLVASAWKYSEVQMYALHRFRKVEVLEAAVIAPKGFELDKAIAAGLAEFANQGKPVRLKVRCTKSMAAYLAETPLAVDQKMSPEDDGWVRLTATVNDTWQLHWWLMGQGSEVEVCAPIGLRRAIQKSLLETTRNYANS